MAGILIFTLVLLMLILFLINDKYQTRQRNNKHMDVLLKEKEWLIKELHHRVKNNLQMMISLLNAQSEFLSNPSALHAIKESRERIETVAIIHKKLYEMDNPTTDVDMQSYITELADTIRDCFADKRTVNFKTDIDDIALAISQSVPLGLILNEAINNAIKYAYPDDKKGVITVSLKKISENDLQLKVTDNGKGLPEGIDINNPKTLGLQLIKLFSEQLDGDLFLVNDNGLQIILNFNTAGYNTKHLES